jgi:hypothetical protein
MRSLLVVLTLSAAVLVPAAPSSAGKVRPARVAALPVPSDAAFVGSDGARRIVAVSGLASPQTPVVTVADLATRRSTSFAAPESSCSVVASPGGIAASCRGVAPVSRFAFYVRSYEGTGGWVRQDIDDELFMYADEARLKAIGQRWFAFAVSGYHWVGTAYVSRIGHRFLPGGPEGLSGAWAQDLDAPEAYRPTCAPLRQSPQPDVRDGPYYAPFAYARPWAVDGPAEQGEDGQRVTIRLLHCGTKVEPVTLCAFTTYRKGECRTPSLTAREVAWNTRTAGFVRDLRTGRRIAVQLPHRQVTVRLVGRHVLVEAVGGDRLVTSFGLLRR